MNKTPEEMYAERLKRVKDAVELKVPDRVPVVPFFQFFPMFHAGHTVKDVMYDFSKACKASKDAILEFDPDMYISPLAYPGKALEILKYNLLKWPGYGVKDDKSYQFVEDEYMRSDDYDHFFDDSSDFMFRKYLPRVCGALEPLRTTTSAHDATWLGLFNYVAMFGQPEVIKALEALTKAGQEFLSWFGSTGKFDVEMKELGYPNMVGGFAFAPLDVIGDTMRGTTGVMLDMYRCPEKLIKAVDKVTPWTIETAINSSKATGNPVVMFALHKGADSFMSPEQYEKFYWPSLRKVMLALIDEGLIPLIYCEGEYTSRLEYLADVPKGKVIYHFESVDIHKAKEVLGGIACLTGNVPNNLLYTGTPADVEDYCRKLIDVWGKDGGFILDAAAVIDEAKPENIKAMIDFTKEYGVYK
ncbi:MAG: uroporphyrinogen decarboxylase family protein [Desulfitobacteriaceae bacterium]|nr:uroporphyrinogen decarboxylase family protein [Desulfitobacteriaceae bacterium]